MEEALHMWPPYAAAPEGALPKRRMSVIPVTSRTRTYMYTSKIHVLKLSRQILSTD